MAAPQRAPQPKFYVEESHREAMAEQYVTQTVFSIEHLISEPNAPLADDFLDIVARVAAVILAADNRLVTPSKQREGVTTVAAHVLRHLKRYKAEEAVTGIPAMKRILATNEIPEEMKRYWNNS
mgnify:CR=1 FL=1